MTHETFLLAVTPNRLREIQGLRAQPVHLAYRLGPGPHLFRSEGTAPRGGLMALECQDHPTEGAQENLAQEVVRECLSRGFRGAVCDFDGGRHPALEGLLACLEARFARQGWRLYVPEAYGPALREAQVLIPSALSGGSLAVRLEEAADRYGPGRVTLALQRSAEDFFLPAPQGSGVPLTRAQLEELLQRLEPSVFFSGELCARYFTYMSRESGAHFVLFDDGQTLAKKLEIARTKQISSFLAAWPEVDDAVQILGLAAGAPLHYNNKK